jgi:hypothetical protein
LNKSSLVISCILLSSDNLDFILAHCCCWVWIGWRVLSSQFLVPRHFEEECSAGVKLLVWCFLCLDFGSGKSVKTISYFF